MSATINAGASWPVSSSKRAWGTRFELSTLGCVGDLTRSGTEHALLVRIGKQNPHDARHRAESFKPHTLEPALESRIPEPEQPIPSGPLGTGGGALADPHEPRSIYAAAFSDFFRKGLCLLVL